MTAADLPPQEHDTPRRKRGLPLILGLVLALMGGGGGFFAVSSGMLGGGTVEEPESEAPAMPEATPASFVPLDPLVINLPPGSGRRLLRFAAQIEVAPEHAAEVESLRPRIVDVLNTYLRAVELADLEDPAALTRLRAQMLRRVQVVAGAGRVRDLLVMEFVLD
ncbi:flagellar basal body-associated FliL family protein [Limimaricola sp. G21655-S1]|uniref:flagellar basal body-associated FliL family protein n=1 Tax=Limimaricola sp. G21655-S1 TaxID=3014768 RepID=UPI0022AEA310|nr:flagellar basal body-associated FliL family protein [Limimaricola sp. G21655-S1]MCZ4261371.1 flagellar basal body-associated FliL family protein [Limimaricola sp. G21655-S1]